MPPDAGPPPEPGPTPAADPAVPQRLAASCVGVVKIYWTATAEVHALKGIDLAFPAGQVTAVVGPSGSGKSSLLRILAAMDRATAGTVTVGETDLSGLSAADLRRVRRRLVGYVFQRPSDNLIEYLSVTEHLDQAARLRAGGRRSTRTGGGADDSDGADGADGALDRDVLLDVLGLHDRRGHQPAQLSGGEQQRVAFAQAVIGRPALVVADEPTAELDSHATEALLTCVRDLAATGVGVVVSTHDPQVVAAADRVYELRHGALESETREARSLSVIDAAGRIQLPPSALALFPQRRAELVIVDGEVRVRPP